MADVLRVAAFELGDPMVFVVAMKTNNPPRHGLVVRGCHGSSPEQRHSDIIALLSHALVPHHFSSMRVLLRHRFAAAVCYVSVVTCRGTDRPANAAGSPSADTAYHGVAVADPYQWLEDGSAAKVRAWIDAQNAHTDSVLSSFTEGPALAKRTAELATSADRFSPTIAGRTLYYLSEIPPQQQPVLVASAWPQSGVARVLVDVNCIGARPSLGSSCAPSGLSITAYWPSPSGRYVAYGTDQGGSEITTIHFWDAQTNNPLPDTLPFAGGGTSPPALAWDADEKGVTFARFPIPAANAPVSGFDVALYHHAFGVASDPAVFGVGYSPIAEYRLLMSSDGKNAALLANKGDGGAAEVYLRGPKTWNLVLGDSAGVTTADYAGDRLLVVATNGTPRGRVIAISPDGHTTTVLSERAWVIQSVAPVSGGMLVVEDSGTRWRVEHYSDNGQLVRTLGLPKENIGIDGIASSGTSGEALVAWSGWTTPTRWQRYDARTGTLTTVFEMKPPADYSKVVARVIDGVSKDGTHVPVTVLALAGTRQDGTAPAILRGYGGFDIPESPMFIGSDLAWLERGGVIADAILRGGSDFGEAWHHGGMGAHKQNVFDDFYAASQALVNAKWTSPDRLGIRGASNGGLLMGAELTQHPEAFRAVVSHVGIYDMLRHETFPNGKFNVPEYGTTTDSAAFAALYAYSPLHHVKQGTAYPSVLMETGVNDARVAPWQTRKFAAALQGATSSGRPVLALTRMEAGHGIGAPFAQRVSDAALGLTFFAHELGLRAPIANESDAKKKVDLTRPR
jgi:prolyl oligopeptidase